MKYFFSFIAIIIFNIKGFSQSYEESPFGFHPAFVSLSGYPDNGFTDAQNLGIKWHRHSVYIFWFLFQPDTSATVYDTAYHDWAFSSVPQDINILANICPQGNTDMGYCLPGSYYPIDSAKYIEFVKYAVERYDGDGINDMPGLTNPIKYWQVGNEPGAGTSGFAALQKITYNAIKEADPEATVLIGGATGFPDNYITHFDNTFISILNELNGSYFDIFDFHWYGDAFGDYRLIDPVTGEDVYDHIRLVLDTFGYSDTIPVWITEMSTYSGNPDDSTIDLFDYQNEKEQAGDYIKRHVYPLARGVRKIFPAFGVAEGFKHDNGYYDHTGLIYDGDGTNDLGIGVKKLAYYSYKLMTVLLEYSNWDNISTEINDSANHIYAYKFPKATNNVFVAWWDYFETSSYTPDDSISATISSLNSQLAIIIQAVPDDTSGISISNYNTAFKKDTIDVTNGSISFWLKESPVYIIELYGESVNEDPGNYGWSNLCPNPVTDVSTLEFLNENHNKTHICIFDIEGRPVKVLHTKESCIQIEQSFFPNPGVYFYHIVQNNVIASGKIVVIE